MTFRRFYTAEGMHNYFWKARTVEAATAADPAAPSSDQGGLTMASHGIRDRVAIIGMGCTPFGELWDKGADDLLIDATQEAIASAGVAMDDIDAFWLGTLGAGNSGLTMSRPLKLDYKPVTRVENFCATGSEALRNACYAVASGAYDVAMAAGRGEAQGLRLLGPDRHPPGGDGTRDSLTSPATFSFLAPSYGHKYGVDEQEMKDVLTRIAWKNHYNGARNPRAQFRKEVSLGDHLQVAPGGRGPWRVRLQRRVRRLRRGHRLPGRGRPPLHRCAPLREGAELRGRARQPDPSTPTTTTPPSRRWSGRPEDAYRAGRGH